MTEDVTSPMRQRDVDWPTYLALCAAGLVLALTWLGPRPAEGLGTLNALAFWAAHVLPALILLGIAQLALGRIAPIRKLPGIAQVGLAGLVGAVLFTPVALAVDALFLAPVSADDAADPLLLRAAQEYLALFAPVTLVWLLINAPSLVRLAPGRNLQGRAADADAEDAALDAEADPARDFWDRVPRKLGRTLVVLSAELHYLRVHTLEGDALILFPFGRAVDLLQSEDGMQVHRSHWVATGQVEEIVTGEGRMMLRMAGDLQIPVSRSYRSAVRAALKTRQSG